MGMGMPGLMSFPGGWYLWYQVPSGEWVCQRVDMLKNKILTLTLSTLHFKNAGICSFSTIFGYEVPVVCLINLLVRNNCTYYSIEFILVT